MRMVVIGAVAVIVAAVVALVVVLSGGSDGSADRPEGAGNVAAAEPTPEPGSGRSDPPPAASGDTSPDPGNNGGGDNDGDNDGGTGGGSDGGSDSSGGALLDPFRPDSVAVDASSVWVSDAACGVVVRIDKATEEVTGSVVVGTSASGVTVAGGSVWVGTRFDSTVARIDPGRLVVVDAVPVPGYALGLSASGNDVWATDPVLGSVYRIDASSGELVQTVVVGANPHNIAVGDGVIFVTNNDDDTVSMVGYRNQNAIRVDMEVGASPLHVALGEGSIWVTDSGDGAVRRLDPETGATEAVIDVGVWPHALAYAAGSVWVGTETGSFWRVDPGSNQATRIDDAEFTTIDTAVDGTDIWIADASGGTVVRFDAATGTVGSVVDLREFGDCNTFFDEAQETPPPSISA